MNPHPDRLAKTLADRDGLLASAGDGPFQTPGSGSCDARINLKLLLHEARVAVDSRGSDQARQRLEQIQGVDLLAGTIQDGTARGVMVALEEVISLCKTPDPDEISDDRADVFEGKELRRKRDLLVASGGARIRFSRKNGVLLVDRKQDVHTENCIRFEDRADAGTLDGFEPVAGERPRLFNPGFLQPQLLVQGKLRDLLVIEGRLGRGPKGYPCKMEFEGRKAERSIRLRIKIDNRHRDHRLRIRFLGHDNPDRIKHHGTPGWEVARNGHRSFMATTLIRSCGTLIVGTETVSVPGGQCLGWIEHEFRLGGDPTTDER